MLVSRIGRYIWMVAVRSEFSKLKWSYFFAFVGLCSHILLQMMIGPSMHPFKGTIDVSIGSIFYLTFVLTGPLGILFRKLESILL